MIAVRRYKVSCHEPTREDLTLPETECDQLGIGRIPRLSGAAANAGELLCAKRRSRVAHSTGSLPQQPRPAGPHQLTRGRWGSPLKRRGCGRLRCSRGWQQSGAACGAGLRGGISPSPRWPNRRCSSGRLGGRTAEPSRRFSGGAHERVGSSPAQLAEPVCGSESRRPHDGRAAGVAPVGGEGGRRSRAGASPVGHSDST
jgi:hypothetical protein